MSSMTLTGSSQQRYRDRVPKKVLVGVRLGHLCSFFCLSRRHVFSHNVEFSVAVVVLGVDVTTVSCHRLRLPVLVGIFLCVHRTWRTLLLFLLHVYRRWRSWCRRCRLWRRLCALAGHGSGRDDARGQGRVCPEMSSGTASAPTGIV